MKLAIATALAAISHAGSVFAETTVTATLDSAQASRVKFIAADAVWDCSGTTCVATVAPDSASGLSGCKDLAKKIDHRSPIQDPKAASLDARKAAPGAATSPRPRRPRPPRAKPSGSKVSPRLRAALPRSARFSMSGRQPAPRTLWKSSAPSAEPNAASKARSGWGIRPKTLPSALTTPAMSLFEPLGLSR